MIKIKRVGKKLQTSIKYKVICYPPKDLNYYLFLSLLNYVNDY